MPETREKARASGETTLERIGRMADEKLAHIGPEWDGLGPDSPVWTRELMEKATAEIIGRENPLEKPEQPATDEETETVRLRCELARLRQDYDRLDKKYASLLGQFQALSGKRGKR